MAQWVNDLACLCGRMGSVLGPMQCVKDWSWCGFSVGLSSGLDSIHMLQARPKKKKKIAIQ